MILERFTVQPLQNNIYLIVDEGSREAAVVDTALGSGVILQRLERLDAKLAFILNTHGHLDHVADDAPLRDATEAKIAIHEYDAYRLRGNAFEASLYMPYTPPPSEADILLHEGDVLRVGGVRVEVLHTPGHTEGSSCFYIPDEGILFSGDTLFAGSCGRVDVPGANPELMKESLLRLSRLPPAAQVLPGHGPSTTMKDEAWVTNERILRALLSL